MKLTKQNYEQQQRISEEAARASQELKKSQVSPSKQEPKESKPAFLADFSSRLANTTRGLVAKNKKFTIVTLNDLVEAMMHRHRIQKAEALQRSMESKKRDHLV